MMPSCVSARRRTPVFLIVLGAASLGAPVVSRVEAKVHGRDAGPRNASSRRPANAPIATRPGATPATLVPAAGPAGSAPGAAPVLAPGTVLTTAAAVRALSPEQATQALPVKVRGVI